VIERVTNVRRRDVAPRVFERRSTINGAGVASRGALSTAAPRSRRDEFRIGSRHDAIVRRMYTVTTRPRIIGAICVQQCDVFGAPHARTSPRNQSQTIFGDCARVRTSCRRARSHPRVPLRKISKMIRMFRY
jgi:hypothetical protein